MLAEDDPETVAPATLIALDEATLEPIADVLAALVALEALLVDEVAGAPPPPELVVAEPPVPPELWLELQANTVESRHTPRAFVVLMSP